MKRTLGHDMTGDMGVALDRLGGGPIESRFFSSVYFDVADLRLLRAGIMLRRRTEKGACV
jgi:hypothetical protein